MTSWEIIEKRIEAAAAADFVTAVYNPKSEGRYWQLHRLKEIFLRSRSSETPVGYVRQAGREEERVTVTTLEAFRSEERRVGKACRSRRSTYYFKKNTCCLSTAGSPS